MLDNTSIFLFTGTGLGMGNKAQELCRYLVVEYNKRCIPIMFDVNFRILQWGSADIARNCMENTINLGVQILSITNDEMVSIGWGNDPIDLFRRFPQIATVLYKKGIEGSSIFYRDGRCASHNSYCVNVGDTVGAGDSFDSGFISCMLEGKTIEDTVRFSCATAGLTCTGIGPLETMPFKKDVEKFLVGKE